MKKDVHVCFKNVEEPEVFYGMDEVEKDGRFLYLYADIGAGVEWFILHDNILYFEIEYKGGK